MKNYSSKKSSPYTVSFERLSGGGVEVVYEWAGGRAVGRGVTNDEARDAAFDEAMRTMPAAISERLNADRERRENRAAYSEERDEMRRYGL